MKKEVNFRTSLMEVWKDKPHNKASIMGHNLLTVKGLSISNEPPFKDNCFQYPVVRNIVRYYL